MTTATVLAQIILFCWFFGCVCTYKFGKYICLFSIGSISFWIVPFLGKWFLLGVLLFWFTVQFFCHWYYTIFGASEKKLKGYNDCFKNTVHIIPASKTKLIPDLYHMILHLLILLNIVLVLCNIFI